METVVTNGRSSSSIAQNDKTVRKTNIHNVDDFPGEDRTFGGHYLYVDLIPKTTWFKNARSHMSVDDWKKVRTKVYNRANDMCEICGKRAPEKIEAHERWSYDDATNVQKLERLIALCKMCHTTTHFGLAEIRGLGDVAFRHLMIVNGWTPQQANDHIDEAFRIWRYRSSKQYRLDLTILERTGVKIFKSR